MNRQEHRARVRGSSRSGVNEHHFAENTSERTLSCGRRRKPLTGAELREIDLRAWRKTIDHLNRLGLTPIGVPANVMRELYAISDDNWRRIQDRMWGAA